MRTARKISWLLLAGCLVLSGVSFAQDAQAKKAVLIIPGKDVQDDEFLKTVQALEDNGIEVTVASTTLDEVTGTNGVKVKADMLLEDVSADNYDAVVFIGGPGAAQYLDDPVAHKLVQDTVAKNKTLGAICLAPVILTNAGVLKDKRATCYPTEGDTLKTKGVNYTAKPVEKDGNIITADGPKSAQEFGKTLSKAIGTCSY
jgi:protease I